METESHFIHRIIISVDIIFIERVVSNISLRFLIEIIIRINVSLDCDSRLSRYRYILNVEICDEGNDWNDWKNCKNDSDTR